MEPSLFVYYGFGSFFVLIIAKHHVGASAYYFTHYIIWVGRQNLHFHTVYATTTRVFRESIPGRVGDKWSTFCHSITYRIGEIDGVQKTFYFLIEWSTTKKYFVESTAKGIDNLFADCCFYLIIDDRHFKQNLHLWCL